MQLQTSNDWNPPEVQLGLNASWKPTLNCSTKDRFESLRQYSSYNHATLWKTPVAICKTQCAIPQVNAVKLPVSSHLLKEIAGLGYQHTKVSGIP
jgi:hypothetical protein